ncbi:hypothetical protein GCM10023149_43170 [Mucilaginibacter gynuensis]|uniref:SRPBCC domain-containing protein n=1 Tax=Mucilaginibacter gynuensis TaxID=1302236 RepID=A0ABP8H708_9SPHI
MNNQDFSTTITVDQTPAEAFDAINSISSWWTENVEGASQKLNDEFEVRFWDVHYSRQKLIEVIPNQKVVWLVTDSRLSFVQNKNEWTGTSICFEIFTQNDKTHIRFTHVGLVPQYECYGDCSNAWTGYIQGSLRDLIATGKGKPEVKED